MAFQFLIQITGLKQPPVWRRLLVSESTRFLRFHHLIQAAFGWENCHLFQFSPGGWQSRPVIGLPFEEDEEEVLDSRLMQLNEVFREVGQTYVYIYDFGDSWEHQVTLEAIRPPKSVKPQLLEGEGSCPPEDCGGVPGYLDLLKVMADPKHPEHFAFKEWLGMHPQDKWDPHAFDIEERRKWVGRV